MADAHRSLYNSAVTAMSTTHLYVKFAPTSLDHMVLLEEAEDLFLYDFPLEYKVVNMGDYYQEPEEGVYPALYAVVKPNFTFPGVPYQIIAELYLDQSNPLLIAESFRLTGNKDDILTDIPYASGATLADLGGNGPSFIPEPECPTGCVALLQINTNTIPVSWEYICDCTPPPPPQTNACGCTVSENRRKPGGCVNVEDTEFSTSNAPATFEPVRRVRITIKDNWFTQDQAMTDDNGCWQVDKAYSGKSWMWVIFRSSRASIRGAADNISAAWQWITTIKDYVGSLAGPNFNNILVSYHKWTAQGSQAHRFWGAATVNNSLHEFHDYAAQDGIARPPNGLDIHIGHTNDYGFAVMSVQNELSISVGIAMGTSHYWTLPFAPVIALVGWAATLAYLPDVHIGIGFSRSDRLKSLAYHEIAHAAHFTVVGKPYWRRLATAEILANGHGDENSFDGGIIEVAESWAEYLGGHVYVHRTYGWNNSVLGTWLSTLEETWNETFNHIPIGLHYDLIDDGIEPPLSCDQRNSTSCTSITDNVSDFTISQLFSCLTAEVTDVDLYHDCLTSNHLSSTPNNTSQLNTLFNQY